MCPPWMGRTNYASQTYLKLRVDHEPPLSNTWCIKQPFYLSSVYALSHSSLVSLAEPRIPTWEWELLRQPPVFTVYTLSHQLIMNLSCYRNMSMQCSPQFHVLNIRCAIWRCSGNFWRQCFTRGRRSLKDRIGNMLSLETSCLALYFLTGYEVKSFLVPQAPTATIFFLSKWDQRP